VSTPPSLTEQTEVSALVPAVIEGAVGDIVIGDNLSKQNSAYVRELIRAASTNLLSLPVDTGT
jgi:hypothetical protein